VGENSASAWASRRGQIEIGLDICGADRRPVDLWEAVSCFIRRIITQDSPTGKFTIVSTRFSLWAVAPAKTYRKRAINNKSAPSGKSPGFNLELRFPCETILTQCNTSKSKSTIRFFGNKHFAGLEYYLPDHQVLDLEMLHSLIWLGG